MSHRKGVYLGDLPVYEIEARQAGNNSFHLLTTSYSISGKSCINCDQLRDDDQTLTARYSIHTNFPPSAVHFAPRTVSPGPSLVMTAGEAIGVWKEGALTGFCVPEALKSVGLPLAGRESSQQPVWGVTAAKWTEERPNVIVAAHRSGSLGLYSVDRLPGAQKDMATTEAKPTGLLDRVAKLFTTPANTPARVTATAETSTGNGCQVFAHLPTTPSRRLSPGPSSKPTNPFFATDVDTLDANVVVAAHNADSSLLLFDTRDKPQQWTPQTVAGGNPKFLEGLGDTSLMTLDKVREEMHIYDLRMASNGSIKALQTFQNSDIFGYRVLVNDALVLRSSEVVMALQRDHSGGRAAAPKSTEGVLAKLDFGALREGTSASKTCMGNTLTDDNCAMAVATDENMLFWSEIGVYVPSNEEEWLSVAETPYSAESLRNAKWLEASGTYIHMLPLR